MAVPANTVTRRAAVLLGGAALVGALADCGGGHGNLRLAVATGNPKGVYYSLGQALARQWADEFGMPLPRVLPTNGSPANIALLRGGEADVAFSAADAAADAATEARPAGQRRIRALARIYDDYLQVVVRADSTLRNLADLRGHAVSIGAPGSGVELIARRLLAVIGLRPGVDLRAPLIGLADSLTALRQGHLDAFFWSGGLPTPGLQALSAQLPLRLLDLSEVLPALQQKYPVYRPATVPASAYDLRGGPVTTLIVPNFLLVTDVMADGVAAMLLRGVFDGQHRLVRANRAALSIDKHSAIDTAPVALHPGAIRYYRAVKP